MRLLTLWELVPTGWRLSKGEERKKEEEKKHIRSPVLLLATVLQTEEEDKLSQRQMTLVNQSVSGSMERLQQQTPE